LGYWEYLAWNGRYRAWVGGKIEGTTEVKTEVKTEVRNVHVQAMGKVGALLR
jgi:hypothetical protein